MLAGDAVAQVNELKGYSIEHFRLSMDRNGLFDVEWGGVPKHLSWNVDLWVGPINDPSHGLQFGSGASVGDRRKRRATRYD